MANLYELNEEILNFKWEVDEETGEISNIEQLNELKLAFGDKVENILKYIKNLESEALGIKLEEERLMARRKAKENKVKALKDYLSSALQVAEKEKMEFACGVVSFRKSKAVEVKDEFIEWAKNNRDDLLKYKEPTANLVAIKEAINCGEEFEFAEIIEKKNLSIR